MEESFVGVEGPPGGPIHPVPGPSRFDQAAFTAEITQRMQVSSFVLNLY